MKSMNMSSQAKPRPGGVFGQVRARGADLVVLAEQKALEADLVSLAGVT